MTFYCVHAEFYDYGAANARVAEKQTNKKPNNQFRQVYGMSAFKIWFVSRERAAELEEMVNGGEVYIDDLISLYEDFLPLEKVA
jgi:hypothetical protein